MRTGTTAAVTVALLLAATPAAAQNEGSRDLDLELPELETWTLDNGLTVAYMGVHRAPVVSVQVWYRAGSKDEPKGKRGIARMFERLMFQGSPRVRPGRHAEHVDRVGGTVDAGSTEDATWFGNTVPNDYLDFVFELEAERMRELVIRQDAIEQEREVLAQQLSQELYDPVRAGLRRFLDVAYVHHPYRTAVGGRVADIESITTEDARAFYDAYFNPNNALVVVVGDVTVDAVRKAAEAHFGPLERGPEPPRPAAKIDEPDQDGVRRKPVPSVGVGLVIGGFHIPEAAHEDIYALQVLSLILGSGDTSVLAERLKHERGLASDVGSQALVWEDPGVFAVMASFQASGNGDELAAAVLEEVERAHAEPSAARLRRAKNQILAGFVYGLQGVSEIGQQVGTSWILTGAAGQFLRDLDQLEGVTAEDVARVAETYLTEANYTVIVSPPPSGGRRTGGGQ